MRRFTRVTAIIALLFTSVAAAALAQSADLVASKSGPASANAGSDVAFSVSLLNIGPDAALSVVLNDPLPAGMTFVSATQNSGPAFSCTTPGVNAPGTVRCTAPSLTAGVTATFTFVFNISVATAPGTVFTNVATVSSATPDPNPENDSGIASTQTPPPPQADLFVSKSGPGSAGPNTNVTYVINAGNAGPDAATSMSLQDTLPGNMTFVSLIQTSGPAFSCATPGSGAGGTVTCTIASLNAGANASFSLVTQVPTGTAGGTSYTNIATVSGATTDPNAENNSSGALTVVSAADLSVTKSASPTATAGGAVTYVLTATNNGPDAAQNVLLQDPLPAGVSFVSATQNSGPAGGCSQSVSGAITTVFCSVSTMNSAAIVQFTVVGQVAPNVAAGTLSNTVTVSSDTFDTNTANNSATASTVVSTSADLALSKIAPATASAGSNLTYTIGLTNNGPSSASTVSLSDILPANTTFAALSQTGGPAFSCITPAAGASGTITCTAPAFASGATANFSVVVQIAPATPSGTVISNTAIASSATSDPNGANNSSTASTTTSLNADVMVNKIGPATAAAGSNITYTITVTNNGPSTASALSLSDSLPANTTFVSEAQSSGPAFTCTTPAAGATGTVNCTAASLAPGASSVFSILVKIGAAVPAGSNISNTAAVSSSGADGNPANNSSTSTTAVTQSADLTVSKTGSATVIAGANITYSVTLTNNGPTDAATVSLSDPIPANTTFVSAAPTSGPASGPAFTCITPAVGGTGSIVCSAPSLVSGGTVVFTFVVKTSSSANGTVISNTASATSATPDPLPANNSATFGTSAGAVADVAIVKTAPATGTAGGNLSYTVTLTNNGPSDAAGVSLSDVLPASTTFVSSTQTSGPAFTCTTPAPGATGTIACNGGPLVSAGGAAFTFVVKTASSTAAGLLSNTATVSTSSTDPAPANNSSTASTTISASADLAVTKTGPTSAGAGSDIVYTLTLTNSGPSNATTVVLTDTTPANAAFVSATQTGGPTFTCTTPASGASGVVTCNAPSLSVGAVATFSVVVHLSTNTPVGTTITNTVSVSSATLDPNAANNTATVSTTSATAIPALSLITLALLGLGLAAVAIVALRGQ